MGEKLLFGRNPAILHFLLTLCFKSFYNRFCQFNSYLTVQFFVKRSNPIHERPYSPHDHGQNTTEKFSHMPKTEDFQTVSELFKQLGDSSRMRIFWILCHCEECVINISALMDMSSPAVSHHLKLLKASGLIVSRREGKEVYYKASDTSQPAVSTISLKSLWKSPAPLLKHGGELHEKTYPVFPGASLSLVEQTSHCPERAFPSSSPGCCPGDQLLFQRPSRLAYAEQHHRIPGKRRSVHKCLVLLFQLQHGFSPWALHRDPGHPGLRHSFGKSALCVDGSETGQSRT